MKKGGNEILPRRESRRGRGAGFALIVVLIVIAALGFLAGSFAFSMKVESRLAANAQAEADLQWLGRSGVEAARFVLAESLRYPSGRHTSLNQLWAGGPGEPQETNGPLALVRLNDLKLGGGRLSVHIVDLERYANINRADPILLNRAFEVIGVDASTAVTAVDSILDWMDSDDDPRMNGAESDYYLALPAPYFPKNGPVDELSELLLVHGISPAVYWGAKLRWHRFQWARGETSWDPEEANPYSIGLVDLFTPCSSGMVNINTASAEVLQILPGIDETLAQNIVRVRAGPDGVEGTEDDTPFLDIGMLNPAVVPGLPPPELLQGMRRFITVQSRTFQVTVDARLGNARRRFHAVLVRLNPAVVETVEFWWE
ncbi:MAG: general secretion pathway protein GspK [Verrucomicrobia bacterium]|nr:general secretion pathway protein GspK [Verrucomicrobiota bacterium]